MYDPALYICVWNMYKIAKKMSERIFHALGASSQMMAAVAAMLMLMYSHLFARSIWIFFPHCKLKIFFM